MQYSNHENLNSFKMENKMKSELHIFKCSFNRLFIPHRHPGRHEEKVTAAKKINGMMYFKESFSLPSTIFDVVIIISHHYCYYYDKC